MSKRFPRGLVVGKFSPLHRGHELVINRAIVDCEEVILLSYSNPELPGCDAARREQWLSVRFPAARRLVISDERLKEFAHAVDAPHEVPANDADDLTHRRFCGFLCDRVLGVTVNAVFTSEEYGDGFAADLTRYFRRHHSAHPAVRHVLVDKERTLLPISGTQLRRDIHAHRDWLAPEVYASFVGRVCLLGGESSGKSTLAEALAREFSTAHAAEYGRDLWVKKSGRLEFADLRHIAEVQIRREEEAARRANRFLFCDTSPLTTLFYCRHLFGQADLKLERMADRKYAFTFLCAPDFAFVQDGTRQPAAFRTSQHEWYQAELTRRRTPFHVLKGPIASRIQQVRDVISRFPGAWLS